MKNKKEDQKQGHSKMPFDKFIDDLEKRQKANTQQRKQLMGSYKETPQEIYNKRYREHAHNRIVVGNKK